jgi:hypothetical protein
MATNEFGPNTAEVQDVVDFVRYGGVLREPFRPKLIRDFDTRIVFSLECLQHYRGGQLPENWCTIEEWFDVKQIDMETYHEACRTLPGDWNTVLARIGDASYIIQEWLSEQLCNILPEEEIEQIADDFEMIMKCRAVFGHNNHFDEKLFRVYQAFGYPCGWVGEYPQGQLVVFSRD